MEMRVGIGIYLLQIAQKEHPPLFRLIIALLRSLDNRIVIKLSRKIYRMKESEIILLSFTNRVKDWISNFTTSKDKKVMLKVSKMY